MCVGGGVVEVGVEEGVGGGEEEGVQGGIKEGGERGGCVGWGW